MTDHQVKFVNYLLDEFSEYLKCYKSYNFYSKFTICLKDNFNTWKDKKKKSFNKIEKLNSKL